MQDVKTAIPVLVNDVPSGEQTNMFPGPKKMVSQVSEIQLDILQENVQEVVKDTLSIFEGMSFDGFQYNIDSITIALNISNGGKVALVGEVNANINSGITIVLKRKL